MSRLKHDKLSEMLAAANAAQQAAEQRSRRLEIKFARSDKGHALIRSAKLQASVAELEAQLSQLQDDSLLKVSFAPSCLDHNTQCALHSLQCTRHTLQCTMHHLMHRPAAQGDTNSCLSKRCINKRDLLR